jgi:hypothetical protein
MFFRKVISMTKQLSLFFGILFFCASITHSFTHGARVPQRIMKKYKIQKRASLIRLCSSYVASLVLSGAIGVATGSVVRYIEKQFDIESSPVGLLLAILCWTLESEFRNDVIAILQQDLDYYQIRHKKSLMFKSAWIASWLAYLQT